MAMESLYIWVTMVQQSLTMMGHTLWKAYQSWLQCFPPCGEDSWKACHLNVYNIHSFHVEAISTYSRCSCCLIFFIACTLCGTNRYTSYFIILLELQQCFVMALNNNTIFDNGRCLPLPTDYVKPASRFIWKI